MLPLHQPRPGDFCWLDLAASDAAMAKDFYGRVFGWTFRDHHAHGGLFTRWRAGGRDMGSLYQLKRAQLEHGVPSHWTPYILVENTPAAALRAEAAGGSVVVQPFDVPGIACIALIQDAVGALVGLWERRAPEVLSAAGNRSE